MNNEAVIKCLDELVGADEEPVALLANKERLYKALGEGCPVSWEVLRGMSATDYQDFLVSQVNRVID